MTGGNPVNLVVICERIPLRRFAQFVLVIVLIGCGEGASHVDRKQSDSEPPVVTVDEVCEVQFPIKDHESLFQWGVGKRNVAEYFWQVEIKQAEARYRIGFTYFNPNGKPKSGTLQQLLDVGQSDVWLVDASLNTIRCGVQVDSAVSNGHLTLRIADPKAVQQLFIEHPDQISYTVGGKQMRYKTGNVPVHYMTRK